jgi:hypothetical protein
MRVKLLPFIAAGLLIGASAPALAQSYGGTSDKPALPQAQPSQTQDEKGSTTGSGSMERGTTGSGLHEKGAPLGSSDPATSPNRNTQQEPSDKTPSGN